MEKARVEVIGHLRQGKTPEEAMGMVGRSGKTYYDWMYKSAKFAQGATAAQEAWLNSQRQASMPWRQRQDEFEPVLRKNYKTWVEYQVDFRKQYFNHDTFDHQWKMLEALERAPAGGITLILIPPEWTKSTLISDVIVGDICDDPNFRIALLSEGQDLARKQLGRLQRRLTYDGGDGVPPLIEHFGPFKPAPSSPKKWNADEFTILTSDHDEADPTVLSVGILGAIRGLRWNRVYGDDIQSLRNLTATAKIIQVIRGDVVTRPGKDGKLIFAGSRVGREDVYGEMERLELIDELFILPALDLHKPFGQQSNFPRQTTPDGVPIVNEAGEQMGWSDEDLAQRREKVGEDQWSRVYMQQPQSDFSSLLTDENILDATDLDRQVGQPAKGEVARMAGFDPSLQNHAAYVHCGYDSQHLFVLDVIDLYKPTTNQRMFAEIQRGTMKYKPDWWVIENNTLQSGYLTDDAFLELRDEFKFNAVGHHTGGQKEDEKLGVPTMMAAICRGEIRFPKISADHIGFSRLFDQLKSWRPDIPSKRLVQDEVMALWFCYLLWKKLREQVEFDLSGWKRQGMDDATHYPHARTHLEGLDEAERARAPITYEQNWDRLTEKVGA
jgi:hypothetical protein